MNVEMTMSVMSLREAEKFFRNGGTHEDFVKKNNALVQEQIDELEEKAKELVECRDFLNNFKEKYITDTFRDGYIGKTVTNENGTPFVQIGRGCPFGCIAAILGEDGKIYAGISYESSDETFVHSVIGQAIALRRAVENRDKKIDIENMSGSRPYLMSADNLQFKHFKNRAYRYFKPEEFSHSRGKTPIVQPQFDEVHSYQYLVLAKKARNKKELKHFLELLEETIINTNPNLKK